MNTVMTIGFVIEVLAILAVLWLIFRFVQYIKQKPWNEDPENFEEWLNK